ncbi:MAG TPA: YHS domain-containing protein [Bryobacteraceae bacterium]|nr:YHS domain-containing protein [Bryobacteraceae bacterium]
MTRDQVCGMDVDPKTARASYEYEDDTYYFCSEECKQKFVGDPESFVSRKESSTS